MSHFAFSLRSKASRDATLKNVKNLGRSLCLEAFNLEELKAKWQTPDPLGVNEVLSHFA